MRNPDGPTPNENGACKGAVFVGWQGLFDRIICNYAIFTTRGKAYDLVGMTNAIYLHSWRTSRHSRHGDAYQIIPLCKLSDLLGRYMAFNELSIYHCGVTGS